MIYETPPTFVTIDSIKDGLSHRDIFVKLHNKPSTILVFWKWMWWARGETAHSSANNHNIILYMEWMLYWLANLYGVSNKLSFCWFTYFPTLTYVHEIWAITKEFRQVPVSSLGWLGSALEIEWGARSRAAALPCLKERLCIWFGCILVASLYLKVDPEPAGEIIYLVWPGNISWSPRSTLNVFLISRITRITCLACCHSKSSGKRLWRSQWKHADTEKNNLRQSITFYFTETVNFRNAICIYLFER